MTEKNGEYYLSLGRDEYMSLITPKTLGFSKEASRVGFRFADRRGYIAKYLVTDRVYFPVVTERIDGNSRNLYMYATSNPREFRLESTGDMKGRLFLFFPKGVEGAAGEYTFAGNLAGYFYIHGSDLASARVANFGVHITDVVHLTHPDHDKCDVLARDCTSDCQGRLCSDDDGCGLPCGCAGDGVCTLTGECLDMSAKIREIVSQFSTAAAAARAATATPVSVPVPVPEATQYNIWSIIVTIIFLIMSLVLICGIIAYSGIWNGGDGSTTEKKENI